MSFVSFVRRLFKRTSPDPFGLTHIRYEGGDGASPDAAILVVGASSDLEGVAATFSWMHQNIGPKDQADERHIDTFAIELPDGTRRTIFFDVTASFAKPFNPKE